MLYIFVVCSGIVGGFLLGVSFMQFVHRYIKSDNKQDQTNTRP